MASTRTSLRDDFDRWAQLSARMLRRPVSECARIVREAGVEKEWNSADAHWYGVLLDDLESGRLERVGRYRELCQNDLEARIADGAAVPSPLDTLDLDGTPAFARKLASSPPPTKPSPDQEGTRVDLAAPSRPPPGHDWTIEQYAWLRAELERFADRAERIWSLRGVAEEHRRLLVDHWEDRISKSPALKQSYDELLTRYRAMLV